MAAVSHSPAALQRTACDRCRQHKLKCLRSSGHEQTCRRCLRAKQVCVTGAARKAGRPSKGSADTSIQSKPWSITPLITPPESLSSRPASPARYDRVARMERRTKCMRQLGGLQLNLHMDFDALRGSRTIDQCEPPEDPLEGCDPSFFASRLLSSAKVLLEVASNFRIRVGGNGTEGECHSLSSTEALAQRAIEYERLSCDMPALISLTSCYTMVIRLFRIILSVLSDSLPHVYEQQALSTRNAHNSDAERHSDRPSDKPEHKMQWKDLFAGLVLGNYDLSGRIDLQILFLANTSEDLIRQLDAVFGVVGMNVATSSAAKHDPTVPTSDGAEASRSMSQRLIRTLLENEAREQPALDYPRGPCGTLKEVFEELKTALGQSSRP